jgi:predicted unusual protein kinase regulating ubiquinone biosynthesis (AarF/ABC1/UbiB family)
VSGLGGRAGRTARLAKLSASTGGRLVSARRAGRRGDDAAVAAAHDRIAGDVLETLGSMKGAAMKLGQMLSYIDLDLPPEASDSLEGRLAALRDAAPASDPAAVEWVLAQDLGVTPEEAFAHWEPEPFAVASVGQVHRARLADGRDVAVKVQHPGVAEAVEADLANAGLLTRLAQRVMPGVDPDELLAELDRRVRGELDYQQEAAWQQAFRDRYAGHPFIRIPEVVHALCRPRVLVVEHVEGATFDEVRHADQATRDRYGEIIFRFAFGSLYRFGLFNSDAHPGNYVFPGDGTVAFLDFGSSRAYGTALLGHLEQLHAAVGAGDAAELEAAAREAGILSDQAELVEQERQLLLAWFRELREPMLSDEPWTYTRDYARRVLATSLDRDSPYQPVLRKLEMPGDYLLLNRIGFGLNSVLGRLEPTANWYRIIAELWDGAPPATPLGEAEAEFFGDRPGVA